MDVALATLAPLRKKLSDVYGSYIPREHSYVNILDYAKEMFLVLIVVEYVAARFLKPGKGTCVT